jgi:hypothetical protein
MLRYWRQQLAVAWCSGLALLVLVAISSSLTGASLDLLHWQSTGATKWADWAVLGVFSIVWASIATLAKRLRNVSDADAREAWRATSRLRLSRAAF